MNVVATSVVEREELSQISITFKIRNFCAQEIHTDTPSINFPSLS